MIIIAILNTIHDNIVFVIIKYMVHEPCGSSVQSSSCSLLRRKQWCRGGLFLPVRAEHCLVVPIDDTGVMCTPVADVFITASRVRAII